MRKFIKDFRDRYPWLLTAVFGLLAFAVITTVGGLEPYRVMSFVVFLSIGLCVHYWRRSIRELRGDEKVHDIFDYYKVMNTTNEHYLNAAGSTNKSNIIERDNFSAKPTTLFAGTFTVGVDIPPGRYTITADSNGSFFVRERGASVVAAKLTNGDGALHTGGVPSITTDIETD